MSYLAAVCLNTHVSNSTSVGPSEIYFLVEANSAFCITPVHMQLSAGLCVSGAKD